MAFCPIVSALCVGIEKYESEHLSELPGARRDAKNFADFLCERKLPRGKLHLELGEVKKSDLENTISKFIDTIKSIPSGPAPFLVVVFIAGHGEQPAINQLPSILTSDWISPEQNGGSVDLYDSILRPLDRMGRPGIKAWITIDACRRNPALPTPSLRSRTDFKIQLSCDPGGYAALGSETDFKIQLSCDPGGYAGDDQSTAAALIRALEDPEKDLEAACNEAQNQVQHSTCRKQRSWIQTRGNFRGIFLPAAETTTYGMSPELLKFLASLLGLLGAIIVTYVFHLLLNRIDMSCAVVGRGAGYQGHLTFFLDVCWWSLNARRLYSMLQEDWLYRWDLLLVVVVSGLNAALPTFLQHYLLSDGTMLIIRSLKYNIINTCMLTLSISMLLQLLSLQLRHLNDSKALGLLVKHLRPSFLTTVLFLQSIIVMNLSPTQTHSPEDSKTPGNLYKKGSSTTLFLLSLMLGAISLWVAFWLARKIGSLELQEVVWRLFVLKLGWCFSRCVHWRRVCLNPAMSNEYHLIVNSIWPNASQRFMLDL